MARSYGFVLCDIDMPNLDGLECIQRLRAWEEEHRPHKRQAVFCMTGELKLRWKRHRVSEQQMRYEGSGD